MPGIIECLALRCAVRVIRDRLTISRSIGRRSISVIRTTCWRSISSQIACYFVGAILSKRFNARGSFSRGRCIVFCNFLAGAAFCDVARMLFF